MLRCSGAKRLEISTASSSERTRMMAEFLAIDLRGDRRRWAACATGARLRWPRPAARRLEVVSRMAEASTSCSACASMSAAIVARIAVAGDDQDLGGTGDEIDADFAGEQFLGGRDVDVAGADDAVGARARCGCRRRRRRWPARRPSERRGARPAGRAVPKTSSTGLRAGDADVGHAGDLRRDRRSSSRWRAADSGPPGCRPPRYRAGARSVRAAGRA